MIALFLSAFVTLFVVIDPPGCAPIYASITNGASAAQRRAMAVRAVGIAAAILLVFALWGKQLLGMLGIELDSFRIAGGVMLFQGCVVTIPIPTPLQYGTAHIIESPCVGLFQSTGLGVTIAIFTGPGNLITFIRPRE